MIEIQGHYNTAKVFTDILEPAAESQIRHLLDQPFIADSKVRIMPDVHSGKVGVVGLTMTITNKVVPNLIGLDGCCGIETALINSKRIDLKQLDKAIHRLIPAGSNVRGTPHHFNEDIDLASLRCADHVDIDRAVFSLGTLGGGNHFIEVGQDEDGQFYLIVHSGSRCLGAHVCEYYQNAGANALGRRGAGADRALAYVGGTYLKDYLFDMRIVQKYADLNRKAIVRDIAKQVKLKIVDQFDTIHNYIDLESMILRKGAVSAQNGERILLPMNMRDGSLLCVGKGNDDWNCSAPHGAGRVLSRKEAKEKITLSQYEKSMKGVFSTTVTRATLDESPFAYKPVAELVENSIATLSIVKTIKSVYNFKAGQ